MKVNLQRHIAIACGGTGGHLFPGLAVAEKLVETGAKVTLIISQKEVDQQGVRQAHQCQVLALPAVGLQRGKLFACFRGFRDSYLITKRLFRYHKPDAVIGTGGFTSAAPILAGRSVGALTFLHESNAIPGRANRWLSRFVDHGFVGFPSVAALLKRCSVTVSGTPVRSQFHERDARSCRASLGLDPSRPMVLVVGGSQGATGINQMVERSLSVISDIKSEWQWFHLAGPTQTARVQREYARHGLTAIVHPFFNNMELALGGATAAISRAGGSSLAELATMRLPSLLVPYPVAIDNHQWHNAHEYAVTGAAQLVEEREATRERVAGVLQDLVENQILRQNMQAALAKWQKPDAAGDIAQHLLNRIAEQQARVSYGRAVFNLPSEAVPEIPIATAERHVGKTHYEQPVRI
jgi:UDP-N-acetylglucosamine--N-acetylmuramyl-(pentapeptide) pyrophosphoryl-undecaprenol N-acetylglucosamine transferase